VVTITENAFPSVAVTNVAIIGAKDDGSGAGTAIFTVPSDMSVASATFTNDPLGTIEVCKNYWAPYDANYNVLSAGFTVNGGAEFWVQGDTCSAPITVPAGVATVSEAAQANFQLIHVSTKSATDLFGTRLLTGDTVNPAQVTVPYGGVGNETVVTFTNTVDPTQFKICKQETSADANLVGDTFTFTYSWADTHGYDLSGSGEVSVTIAPVTATNPTGLACSELIWGPPAVDPSNYAIPMNVSELPTSNPAGVQVTAVGYQGNGSVVASDTKLPSTDGAWICIDPGAGINVVTFTNGRTAPDLTT